MKTYIKRVQDQAPTGKPRDKFDKLLKFQNPNLYYGYLHIECYYFCQQCEDNFEVAESRGHKSILFAAGFLKDCILN